MQLNAGFFSDAGYKVAAVGRIADSGSGHGDGFVGLVNFAHVGKAFHGFYSTAKGFFGEHIFFVYLLAKTQRLLLIIYHIVGAVFVNVADD